jgi:hypothetical protein
MLKKILELTPLMVIATQHTRSAPDYSTLPGKVIEANTIVYGVDKIIVGEWRLVEHNGSFTWLYTRHLKEF